ncbi:MULTISPECIES: DUF397 domain-containing protein [unclassified Streptomyces]|uniref:DUF397 domain-containing protein n=1 Tax=unclassified Streptomyces TaxID=2593676 RepID=UPI00081DAD52|nr:MULTISPECIES: DUF397 domain-containing protein [unclassified Streptomyces]MYR28957.1 DUF397 domain-containing protein [Streptomyces sp. SID4945]SCF42690.1 protein of unknown function [Streptomyces sp. LcepLS]
MAEWRKSTYSDNGGSCVEAAANWRTSSYSNNGGTCVEVATNTPHAIPVRDSKNPAGPHLCLTPTAFAIFVASVQRGTFDV